MGAPDVAGAVRTEAQAPKLRVAFVLGIFPLVSETFVVEQIAQLLDRGVDVRIFSLSRGDTTNVARSYFAYDMEARTVYLDYPRGWLARVRHAFPTAARLARRSPRVLLRAINVFRFGRWALSLKLLYWVTPLAGERFDVIHCHFGTVAHDFLKAREAAMLDAPLVTTFYGVDVSRVFRDEHPSYYDDLKEACELYFVMSADMKERVVAHGFPAERVQVHPVSVTVDDYAFTTRSLTQGEELRLLAVGRFVEKKGFDDLLRALAIAKEQAGRSISCTLVGGGPLEADLRRLCESLDLEDVVHFAGMMPLEDVVQLFASMHVLVQPSKTAADGDME